MASIDELTIELNANASKANDAIDRLSGKIGNLSKSLSGLNTSSLTGLANGVNKLSASMQSMKSVGTADFTRLAKNLNALGSVNTANLNRLASATTQISKSIINLSGATQGITALGSLANGIRKLGQPASVTAATNIPRLTVAIGDMTRRLSGAKSVSTNLIQITRAIASLSRVTTNDAIANIPKLTSALNNMITTLSQAPKVSKNLIQLTYAISGLSRVSGSTGNSTRIVRDNLFSLPSATSRANKGFTSLASTIGKVYATYFLLFRAFGKIGNAMELASNLTEVENVVDHTFGAMRVKLDDFTKDSIEKFGMSELAAKQYASRYQAMGVAMGISNNAVAKSTEFLDTKLGESAKIYGDLGKSMADVSVNLTKLTSDYASFFDIAQSDVAEDFQSIFTGQTKPLRAYGLDLTETTLKEFALNNGLNANINAMTQAEKAMLRYQYVMANSSHVMGDFARTSDTWHNTITRLKNNFQMLGITVGKAFINLLKPVAVFVNNAIVGLNKVAVAISNALGKLLGWEYEEGSGGIATEYEDAAEGADDLATGTGKAAKAAKELKKQLQGIDELNVLTTNDDNGAGGAGGGGSSITGGGATGTDGSWHKRENPWISDIDTWEELGNSIRDGLISAMNNIPWDEVYSKASGFAEGLSEFLNGLFEKNEDGETVLGGLGKTIAGALKTAIIFAFTLGKGLKFKDIGEAIADFFNKFNEEMGKIDPITGLTGWQALADTLDTWVDGIKDTIVTAVKKVKWKEVIKGAFDFIGGLELDTLTILIGAFAWKHGGKEIVAGALKGLMSTAIETGIGEGTVTLGTAIPIIIATIAIGFNVGKWLYDNTEFSDFADAIIEWMTKENGTEIDFPKAIGLTLGAIGITIGGLKVTEWIIGGVAKNASALTASIVSGEIGASLASALGFADVASMSLAIGTAAAKLGILIGVAIAGYKIGNKIYESLTGEEVQGGLTDLILGDYSWDEIGQAISDGAVLDISLTPLLQWVSGDDTITTQEIIDAGAQMIDDIVTGIQNLPKKAIDLGLDILSKLKEAYEDAKEWLKDKALDFTAKIPDIVEDIKGKYETIKNWLKDNTLEFVAGVKDKASEIITGIKEKWDNWKVSAKELKTSISDKIQATVDKLKNTWENWKVTKKSLKTSTTAKSVMEKLQKLKEKWDSIKTGTKSLKATFTDNISSKLKKIKDAWDKISTKAKTLTISFKDTFTTALKNAWNKLANGINKGITIINNIPGVEITKVPILTYATGGFPEDGWFRASHGEIMGKFDNGQSVVANNIQITEGISSAVQRGNREMVSYMQQQVLELRQQNDYLYQLLQKETGISYKDVFEATRKGASEYQIMNGRPAFI